MRPIRVCVFLNLLLRTNIDGCTLVDKGSPRPQPELERGGVQEPDRGWNDASWLRECPSHRFRSFRRKGGNVAAVCYLQVVGNRFWEVIACGGNTAVDAKFLADELRQIAGSIG